MDTKNIGVAVIAVLIGAAGGYMLAGGGAVSNQHVITDSNSMHSQMSDMMVNLNGKTGDDFDKAFISEMIVHHQGAVAMAQAALINANHQEIKEMANAIITAQTAEIRQMKDWQKAWYGVE